MPSAKSNSTRSRGNMPQLPTATALPSMKTLGGAHPAGAGGADGALIAASVEMLALWMEGNALTDDKASQAFWKLHLSRHDDLENEIIDTPATTQGGLLAKAQAANSIVCLDNNQMPLPDDAMLWSLCRDILSAAAADAELIATCHAFDQTERRYRGLHGHGPLAHLDVRDDAERNLVLEPLEVEREALIDRLVEMQATTLAGFQARAFTLTLYDDNRMLNPAEYQPDRMLAALLRDMTGGSVA